MKSLKLFSLTALFATASIASAAQLECTITEIDVRNTKSEDTTEKRELKGDLVKLEFKGELNPKLEATVTVQKYQGYAIVNTMLVETSTQVSAFTKADAVERAQKSNVHMSYRPDDDEQILNSLYCSIK